MTTTPCHRCGGEGYTVTEGVREDEHGRGQRIYEREPCELCEGTGLLGHDVYDPEDETVHCCPDCYLKGRGEVGQVRCRTCEEDFCRVCEPEAHNGSAESPQIDSKGETI
jgi:hypothetical protein